MSDKFKDIKLVVLDFIHEVAIAVAEWAAKKIDKQEIEDRRPLP